MADPVATTVSVTKGVVKKNRVFVTVDVNTHEIVGGSPTARIVHDLGSKGHTVALVDDNFAATAGEGTTYAPILFSVNKDVNADIVTFLKLPAATTFRASFMFVVEKAGSLTK